MTRKSKQQCVSTVTKGVLIAQQLTYPLARISKMSPNCPKYRIFRGLLGNITFTDTQWITAGLTHGSQVLRAARCLRFGASGMTLRRASPSLFSCRVALCPRTFAPYPSRSSQTGADRCNGSWRLIRRFFAPEVFAPKSSLLGFHCVCRIGSWCLRTLPEGGSPNT